MRARDVRLLVLAADGSTLVDTDLRSLARTVGFVVDDRGKPAGIPVLNTVTPVSIFVVPGGGGGEL